MLTFAKICNLVKTSRSVLAAALTPSIFWSTPGGIALHIPSSTSSPRDSVTFTLVSPSVMNESAEEAIFDDKSSIPY